MDSIGRLGCAHIAVGTVAVSAGAVVGLVGHCWRAPLENDRPGILAGTNAVAWLTSLLVRPRIALDRAAPPKWKPECLGVARRLRFPSLLLQPLGHLSTLESTGRRQTVSIGGLGSAERERERLHASIEELDLELRGAASLSRRCMSRAPRRLPRPTFFTAWIPPAGMNSASPALSVTGGLPSSRYSREPSTTYTISSPGCGCLAATTPGRTRRAPGPPRVRGRSDRAVGDRYD